MRPFGCEFIQIAPAIVLVASTGLWQSENANIGQIWISGQRFLDSASEIFVFAETINGDDLDGGMLMNKARDVIGPAIAYVFVVTAVGPDGGFIVVPEDDVVFRQKGFFLTLSNRHRLIGNATQHLPDAVGIGVVILLLLQ